MLHFEYWSLWLIGGFALLILEIFLPPFLMASFAIATFFSAFAGAVQLSFPLQVALFIGVSISGLWIVRPYLLTLERTALFGAVRNDDLPLRNYGVVTEVISPETNQGTLMIDTQTWPFQLHKGSNPDLGDTVKIIRSLDGVLAVELFYFGKV